MTIRPCPSAHRARHQLTRGRSNNRGTSTPASWGVTAEQAVMNVRAHLQRIYPSVNQLRTAGVDAHVAHLEAELRGALMPTRRGRLMLRLSRWRART